jgi:hypothetical protein
MFVTSWGMACCHWDSSQTKLPSAHRFREVCRTFLCHALKTWVLRKDMGSSSKIVQLPIHIYIYSNSVTDVRNPNMYWTYCVVNLALVNQCVCVCMLGGLDNEWVLSEYIWKSVPGFTFFPVVKGWKLLQCTWVDEYVHFNLSPSRWSVIEVMMHEQYNFEPAEIVECSQNKLPGRQAVWLWTCVWGVHMFWYHNHGRVCIADGKCICVVDIDPLLWRPRGA